MSGTSQSRGLRFFASFVKFAIFVVALLQVYAYRQFFIDQFTLLSYAPSTMVTDLAERAGMSEGGVRLFYVSQPSIEDAQRFNQDCGRKEAAVAILGCYDGRNIFIYNVTDPRLDGIREVTAAHEMLHAAYVRLNGSEKARINALIETEFTRLKTDKDLAERMAFYARTEPGERDNELHSVIGTEVASVSPELEKYYERYFTSRKLVVALHQKYSSVFADLQARGDVISAQLTRLSQEIQAESAAYNSGVATLNSDIAAFNARAHSGGFGSEAEFQRERAGLLARITQLDAQRDAINNKVAQYNALQQELAGIASQSAALNDSIDSTLAPPPSL